MTNTLDKIAELLPEGFSESGMEEVGSLVETLVQERVDSEIKGLEAKVSGYLRMKIDEVKGHALAELEQENETFKNARIFESLKALMSLELNSADEDNAVAQTKQEFDEIQEENDVLIRELNSALTECSKMENTLRVLSEKIEILEDERHDLHEAVVALEESATLPFESNERAVVISEQSEFEVAEPKNERNPRNGNEFINEDMMAFMPFKK